MPRCVASTVSRENGDESSQKKPRKDQCSIIIDRAIKIRTTRGNSGADPLAVARVVVVGVNQGAWDPASLNQHLLLIESVPCMEIKLPILGGGEIHGDAAVIAHRQDVQQMLQVGTVVFAVTVWDRGRGLTTNVIDVSRVRLNLRQWSST